MARIVLTGLNGYGGKFVAQMLQDQEHTLVAVVSGSPQRSEHYEELVRREVHFYKSIEACLEAEDVDLVVICTPAFVHYREVMACLAKGVSVYCEKPLTPTLDKTLEIRELAAQKGATVAVGFQWSYSRSVQGLKSDLLNGRYGKLCRLKSLADFTRPVSYYKDSAWKGRNVLDNGEVLFDNVVSNVTAHFLHNMLFLAGEDMHSAMKMDDETRFESRCYRAHAIEGFDTVSLRISRGDVDIFLYGTLASDNPQPLQFELVCEKGRIVYPYQGEKCIAGLHEDGTVTIYGDPDEGRFEHYKEVLEAMAHSLPAACNVHTVEPFQRVVEYLRLYGQIENMSGEIVHVEDDRLWVEGMSERLTRAYHLEQPL